MASSGQFTLGSLLLEAVALGPLWLNLILFVTINMLKHQCMNSHPCHGIVQMIRKFSTEGGNFTWSHALREANQVADRLGNFAYSLNIQLSCLFVCFFFMFLLSFRTLFWLLFLAPLSRGAFSVFFWVFCY